MFSLLEGPSCAIPANRKPRQVPDRRLVTLQKSSLGGIAYPEHPTLPTPTNSENPARSTFKTNAVAGNRGQIAPLRYVSSTPGLDS
jgi:hypothetical protein